MGTNNQFAQNEIYAKGRPRSEWTRQDYKRSRDEWIESFSEHQKLIEHYLMTSNNPVSHDAFLAQLYEAQSCITNYLEEVFQVAYVASSARHHHICLDEQAILNRDSKREQ